ncbi:MAG: hypothetical protein VX777_05505 [Chlamydiota bacterium]|nr:hypothetical protein [Chlamydiota bacterium]
MSLDNKSNKIRDLESQVSDVFSSRTQPEKSPSLVGGFLNRILKTFKRWRSPGSDLAGRAQKIVPKINVIIDELKTIDETCKVENSIFSYYIIHPLIREGSRLKKNILSGAAPIRSQLVSHYILWIDRSYKWIERYNKDSKADLADAVIDHIVKETVSYIEKDISLVHEYQEQQLDNLDIGVDDIERMKGKIQVLLFPFLNKLEHLYDAVPVNKESFEVRVWRERIDEERQILFDECLSAIDDAIQVEFPLRKSKEVHDHLVDILDKIIFIESSVPAVKRDAEIEAIAQDKKRHIRNKIFALHQQAYQLSLDIRLSQELFDRLQSIMQTLDEIAKKLD